MSTDTPDIKTLLGDLRRCHSEFQMDFFITTTNGGTPYGMYMQALKELNTRHTGLLEMYVRREELELDKKEVAQPPYGPEGEMARVVLEEKKIMLEQHALEQAISEQEREFRRFLGQARCLKKHLGELTPEDKERLEREFWMHRLKGMVVKDVLTVGHPTGSTIDLVAALPMDMRDKAVAELLDAKQFGRIQREWLSYDPMDGVDTIPQVEDNVQKLIEG
jgi:hypothetical protein